jgi:hypothetical protein
MSMFSLKALSSVLPFLWRLFCMVDGIWVSRASMGL